MTRKIVSLSAGNSLFFRQWVLSEDNKGYRISRFDNTKTDCGDVSYYIPTVKALAYIRQAQEGTLPIHLLCWGCEEYARNRDGSWEGDTWVR